MRTDGYTMAELDALPLLPLTRGQEIIGYVDINHPAWTGDRDDFLNAMAEPENQTIGFAVRRCSSSVKMRKERVFFPYDRFGVKVNKGKASWETSVRDFENQASREQAQAYREKNIPFLRMYAMGSPSQPIHCSLTGLQIDNVKIWKKFSNAWVQHHFRFVNGKSVLKENADPGAILSSTDFSVPTPRSLYGLQDMARTIFLSATAHDTIHKEQRDGDITDYENHQLPWALRSEANWEEFNAFVMGFGYEHFGDYQTWFDEQKN